jgi:hypothetical protein
MLRSLALALSVLAASVIAASVVAPSLAHADAGATEPVRFPMPKDAEPPQPTKGSGGKVETWTVPRGRTIVTEEVRAALKKEKWAIVKDEPSPSGNATRIQAKKGGQLYKASFTGDTSQTVIILTLP